MNPPLSYRDFLAAKVVLAQPGGFEVADSDINPLLKPHQRKIVRWAIRGGRRAIFAAFGLGKTVIQLEIIRLVRNRIGGKALIVIPLGVRREFFHDAHVLATGDDPNVTEAQRAELAAWLDGHPEGRIEPVFIRSPEEAIDGINLTNYEPVRDGKIDPCDFSVASLDEAACLRGFGGTKTFREFMRLFDGLRFKFVATATPSPNEYIEMLAYSAFLEIMDVGQAKTRFFKRNSEQADKLTLHPHKEDEFWKWVASWGLFVGTPSDLGCPDDGYVLPPLNIMWHEVPSDHSRAGEEKSGQGRLLRNAAASIVDGAHERRDSIGARVAELMRLRAINPEAHRVIWHTLEDERLALEKAIPSLKTVYGSQDLDEREAILGDFAQGRAAELATKPVIAGSGSNFQRHCAWEIFLGIDDKFNDLIQAVHRCYRFLQREPVRIDIIYTEAQRPTRDRIEAKWRRHDAQRAALSDIVRKYGLNEAAMADSLTRAMGVERREIAGDGFVAVNADCVEEAKRLPDGSVDLILTSIPFSTQYEYSPNYADFGHTDDDRHFWAQMDFLIPELFRVLAPGRIAAIHVKDRVVPGGMTGLGFRTVAPFSDDCTAAFRRHGFAFMARKTIVTDVVRENNQTYRLGWTDQCKDATTMGAGLPEYLLLFRKPQTDRRRGYADRPVVKPKKIWDAKAGAPEQGWPEWQTPGEAEALVEELEAAREDEEEAHAAIEIEGESEERWRAAADAGRRVEDLENQLALGPQKTGAWLNPDGYSRARWQLDAHGFTRSDGNRLLTPEEIVGLDANVIFKLWRRHSLENVYSFVNHVAICEALEQRGALPPTFMLLPPHSAHPDVWTDVTRMRTLNGAQQAAGREMHLCPLQFDIVDRIIEQFSMKGETVLDPFGGLMTVPLRALQKGRRGVGIELNPAYFADGVGYLEDAARERSTPTLFDLMGAESEENAA
jgi:hypothetical protein